MGRLKSSADILGTQEIKTVGLWKALAAEFLGTLILVLFGCASTLDEKTDIVRVSLTFGFTLACLIQALGHISGCHVNPSVTLGMLVARYISVTRSILYVVAQTLGGIAGAGILYGITPESLRYGMGCTRVNPELTEGQAFGVEVLCTFLLVFTIFGSTDSRRTDVKGSISLAIGLAAICTHMFGVYWAGPVCGGILGALVYQALFRGAHKPTPPPSDLHTARPLIPITHKELKNLEMEA
ncbi:aquaporin-4-like [Hyalella azteca]|uniref:Aquaporin-4-like n=1 Tax=Hyalella azteca TaxID=294128 RepID=A0A8B7PBP1_HYAAZ|nr:aquaporin-4-like [Hyalella azteca]